MRSHSKGLEDAVQKILGYGNPELTELVNLWICYATGGMHAYALKNVMHREIESFDVALVTSPDGRVTGVGRDDLSHQFDFLWDMDRALALGYHILHLQRRKTCQFTLLCGDPPRLRGTVVGFTFEVWHTDVIELLWDIYELLKRRGDDLESALPRCLQLLGGPLLEDWQVEYCSSVEIRIALSERGSR